MAVSDEKSTILFLICNYGLWCITRMYCFTFCQICAAQLFDAWYLLFRKLIDFDEPVASYWQEFAVYNKERITVRDILAEQVTSVLYIMSLNDTFPVCCVPFPVCCVPFGAQCNVAK